MLLRKLFDRYARRNITNAPFPRDAYFLLSDRCNARCSMCSDNYFCNNSKKEITLDNFKRIARNIHLENRKAVILTGGEPLLNRDFFEILSFINHSYPHISIVICTNGIALTRKTTEDILQKNIHSISVSVNAGTKETYKKIMQVDFFEKVVTNLEYYQELCIKLKKPSNFNLSFVANKKNIEDLLKFVELANAIGVKNLSSTYCRFFPMDKRLMLSADKESLLGDNDSLYFHQPLSDKYFKEADILAKRFGINFVREPLFSERIIKERCHFPFSSVMVGFDGEIFPCCGGEVIFKEKVKGGLYDFGNALKEQIENFWNNRHHQALRYSVLHPENPAVPECGVCTNILKWKGNIRKAHILEWNDLSNKSIDFGYENR